MTAEAPRPIHKELDYEVPWRPWTEDELTEVLKRILGPIDPETPGPLSKNSNRINPLALREEVDLSTKNFTLEGIAYFCRFQFHPPSNLGLWPHAYYVPFPEETGMNVEFPMGEQPVVKRIPLMFDAGRHRGKVNLNYILSIDGMPTLRGVTRSDYTKLEDIVEYGVIVEGAEKTLMLPSNPKRLSTIELTFSKPNPRPHIL